jgi:catechol 2,3-dioxygenase-like lactoylglutathione lyase family enzyme
VANLVYKELCIDAVDTAAAARFWAPTLGLRAEARGDLFFLSDGVDGHSVWINPVPEPRTVKQRVHIDVHVGAVSELLDRGARVVDDTQGWTVMADPESGGELCAFVRPAADLRPYRLYELIVDSRDPAAIGAWWADRFGIELWQDEGISSIEHVPGMPVELVFVQVPEPKTVKNRIHWDVAGDTAELVAAGATLLRPRGEDRPWDLLADPEGNEFCVFTAE